MVQERIESGGNEKRKTSTNPATDISSVTSSAGKVLEKVRVVHGANEGYFELAGKNVGQVKKSLRDVFNIPSDAEASIAGNSVGDDYILESGQSLEFCKETGTKGGKGQIRWLIRRDMPEVLAIEKSCFEEPWTEENFLCVLRQRNCIGMVIERDNCIIGFMIYELYSRKLRILNFAVCRDYHRKGYGSQMVNRLKDKLSQQRRKCIDLEVRETNLAAQLFFQSLGFRAVHVERQYFEDTNEDAYLMKYQLNSSDGIFDDDHPYAPKNRISEYINDLEQRPPA